MGGDVSKLLLVFILFTVALSGNSCPSVCICKWKNGKQTVECENQGLLSLPDGIYVETQVLNISGNRLSVLPASVFERAGLLNLQRLYIRNSKLRSIDPLAFNQLINLVELDLSHNLLTQVPDEAFKSTQFLRDLNLAGNELIRLSSSSFSQIRQLEKLDLSSCGLIWIDDFAFSHLKILQSLKINQNKISTISKETVDSISKLHAVELHDNPWNCDCRLRDLKVWIEHKKPAISPICESPQRLHGRKFTEISSSDFACPPVIHQNIFERQIAVYEGDNATLICSVEQLPVSSISWYSERRLITNNMALSAKRKFLITIDSEAGVSNLTLTNPIEKDSGDFLCVVENSAGFNEANFTLIVSPPEPSITFPKFTTQHLLFIAVGLLSILLILSIGVLVTFWRRKGKNNNNILQQEPKRINYDNNSILNQHQQLQNHQKTKSDSTDNPDLILETNNTNYQESVGGVGSSIDAECSWGGFDVLYPPDYGLPIIEMSGAPSIYSETPHHHTNNINQPPTPNQVLSWHKNNKVNTRIIRAPRDSPDEGYQEGYVGTDV